MLESAVWIVEYSLSKKDFQVREIGRSIEENLHACIQGVSSDYQLIGVFHAKESALIFMEGFKQRLPAFPPSKASPSEESPCNTEKGMLYEDTLDFIKDIIKAKPFGFTKTLCKEANLTYPTVIGLLKKSLKFQAPELVMELLVALGYDAKMTRHVEMSVADGKKSDETITYFITPYLALSAVDKTAKKYKN